MSRLQAGMTAFPAVAALVLALTRAECDAQLLWDTSPGPGIQGGSGNWLGGPTWSTIFGNNMQWSNGTVAVFNAGSGTVTLNGAVTANGLIFNVSSYTISGSSVLTLAGSSPSISVSNAGHWAVIDAVLSGSAGLTKNGAGDLYLFRPGNGWPGQTTINAGRLRLATNPLAAVLPAGTPVVIADVAGAILDLDFATASIGSLAGGGATGGTVLVTEPSFLSVGGDNTSTTFAGIITATGTVVKTGTGVLELTNNGNTFTRTVNISNGTLRVPRLSSSSGDPLGGAPAISLGGTLAVTQSGSKQANLFLGGGTIEVSQPASQLTITGNFTGSGFTKSGPGTLQLSGAGTYLGPTNITAGTLDATQGDPVSARSTVTLSDVAGTRLITDGSPIGGLSGGGPNGGEVVLQGGNGLTVGANDASTTFAGTITGSGAALTKVGTGVLTLTGPNTYAAATTINAGTLRIGGGNAIPNTSAVTVSSLGAATLDLNGGPETIGSLTGGGSVTLGAGTLALSGASTFSGNITGSGGVIKAGASMFTLNGANTFTGPLAINGGTVRLAGGSALSDSTSVSLANVASVSLDLNGSSETIGALSGGGVTGGDVTLGSGTLTVGTNNSSTTYGGIISGVGGSLVKAGTGALTFNFIHTFTGDIAIRGGTLSVSAVTNAGSSGLLGAGSTMVLGGAETMGTLSFTSAGADSSNRAINLNGGGGAIDVSEATGALTVSGTISGSGGLTKTGPGTVRVSGNNTYSGPTVVAAGKLQISGGNAIGDTSALNVANTGGATLELLGGNETVGSLMGGDASGGVIALGSATLTVGGDGASTNFAGAITGTGGLTKNGAGALSLSGANTYTGATTVNAGTVRLEGGAAVADTSAVVVASGALLDLSNADEAIGSLAGSGGVSLGSRTLTLGADNTSMAFGGIISGNGGLAKTGTGTFTLSGANNFTGTANVASGTLVLDNGLGTPGGALSVEAGAAVQARNVVNRPISGAGTITATGTLFLGDFDSSSGIAFAGTLAVGANTVFLADVNTAELGVATTLGADGRLHSLNGAAIGSGESVTVAPSGSASIGGPFINNGTVNGPTAAAQSLTFTDDVSGAGNFTGNITFSDGYSPGLSTAAVSLENFKFDGTTTLHIEIGGLAPGAQYDRLNFTGSGVLGGELNVLLVNGFVPQEGNTFTFIQGGALSGAFAEMNLPPLGPGLSWDYGRSASAATLTVVAAPVDLRFVSMETLPNGHVVLTCIGAPGRPNRVEANSSLAPASWQTIASITADGDGNFTFTDTAAPGFRRRFYRLSYP